MRLSRTDTWMSTLRAAAGCVSMYRGPARQLLEIDELAYLRDHARAQDPPLAPLQAGSDGSARGLDSGRGRRRAASEGKSQTAIVRELGLAKGSVSYDLKRLNLGAIEIRGSWRDRLHPRLLGLARQRAVRPEDRPAAAARRRAGALADP